MTRTWKATLRGRALALAAIALAGASHAWACGPTRNKHTTTIEIDAPAQRVWEVVGNYADFTWTGKIARTEATGGVEPNVARRTWHFPSGATFTDQMSMYDPAEMSLSFVTESGDVKELPVTGYASRITVRDTGGHATVEWRGAFVRGFPNNDPPPELSDEAAIAAVTAFQQAALDNLKRTLEARH